ncbi:hypothetical protein HDU78_007595 [Chytriomyces hyalinus]|nr:hypothetical protein HDU78_007595 [Chytriomyces hyalinus]
MSVVPECLREGQEYDQQVADSSAPDKCSTAVLTALKSFYNECSSPSDFPFQFNSSNSHYKDPAQMVSYCFYTHGIQLDSLPTDSKPDDAPVVDAPTAAGVVTPPAIAGITLGAGFAVGLFVVLLLVVWRRRGRRSLSSKRRFKFLIPFMNRNASAASSSAARNEEFIPMYLSSASENFSAADSVNPNQVKTWSVDQVCHWARSIADVGMEMSSVLRYHNINGEELLNLSRSDMRAQLGLSISAAIILESSIEKLSSANADARFNSVPDQCTQAVMNAVINLSNSCQSSEAFPFALSNSLPAKAGLGSPNYSNPTTMQAFCQTTHGIALSVDGSVVAPSPTTSGGVLTTTTGSLTTTGTVTSSRTLTSTAAPSPPAVTTGGSGGGGFMFPSSTGNSFAFPTSAVAGGSQNSNSGTGAAQGMSGGAIAGIIVGVLVLLGLVGGLVYWFRSKKDTSDEERLDVGPLPPTSQFSSSNPAYHTPNMEPPSVAGYHYQQSQQQPVPSSARSDHMYNMPANNTYTPSAATSDTLQDQQAPPIPPKQTPTNVFDAALNSAYTSYTQTAGVPVRSPAMYDAAIASVAPKSLQTTNPEDWSVEQCAYWAREIPEFGAAVSWQILNKRVSGRTLLTLTRQEMQSELGLAFGEAAAFETSISKLFGRDSSVGMDAPPVYFESAGQRSNAAERDVKQAIREQI